MAPNFTTRSPCRSGLIGLIAWIAWGLSIADVWGGTLVGHVRDPNWFARRDVSDPYGVGYYEYAINANGTTLGTPGGGDDTDVFGAFSMGNLPAGTYNVASWDVWWRSAYVFGVNVPVNGSSADVDLRLKATMWGYPAFWDDTGYHEFGQTFEATGPVSMIYLRAPFGTSYTLTVHEGGPGGPQVGVSRSFSSAGDHRLIYGYGDMPTLAGQTYYVRIRTASPQTGGVLRQMDPRPDYSDPMPGGCLWLGDGITLTPHPDRDLGLIIMSDDDGLLTNLSARRSGGDFNNVTRMGQSFVARGVGLISAAFWLADGSDPTYAVQVYQGGPGGGAVGTSKRGKPARRTADPEMLVVWAPGECPLVAGETYYIEVTRDGGGTFNAAYVNSANPFPHGTAYRDGLAMGTTDLAGTLMEEASSGSAARGHVRIMAGPDLPDAERGSDHLLVRWTTDVPSDSRVEFAVDHPPYTGLVSDEGLVTDHSLMLTGLQAHALYHLRVRSSAAGLNEGISRDVVITTMPAGENLLQNPGFEEGTGSSPRDVIPGWTRGTGLDLKTSDGSWFSSIPPRAGNWLLQGAISGGNPDSYVQQRVPGLVAGERYTFSAWVSTWMRENNQFKYDVWNDPGRLSHVQLGIDPNGGTDPDAPGIVWTPRLYSHLYYSNPALTAQAVGDAVTVFIRFRGNGGQWHLYGVDECVLTGENAPPVPARAEIDPEGQLRVRFNKAVDAASAVLPSNYSLAPMAAGEEVAVLSAVLEGDRTVALGMSAPAIEADYSLIVSNVLRPGDVFSEPFLNGSVPVLVVVPLFDMDAMWRYEQRGQDPGIDWATFGYDDASWPEGPSVLAREDAALPEPIRTPLTVGTNKIAFYFRKRLAPDVEGPTALLRWRQLIDDGVVFYLNGQEWARSGMAPGTVTPSTTATRVVGDAGLEGPFETVVTNWIGGENLVAAEVHQQGAGSSDVVFGLAMEILVQPSQLGIAIPNLEIELVGNQVELSWPGTGWTLQHATSLHGTWYSVPTASSPFRVSTLAPKRYFRLRR